MYMYALVIIFYFKKYLIKEIKCLLMNFIYWKESMNCVNFLGMILTLKWCVFILFLFN